MYSCDGDGSLKHHYEKSILGGYILKGRIGYRREEMVVSHLLFADDMLVFCEPFIDQKKKKYSVSLLKTRLNI